MGYELARNQPLANELKRILSEQVEEGLSLLKELYETDPPAAVHQLRKTLRRMRALLRLVRPGIGEAAWSLENTALRDLGRRLSPARDAAVMRQTLAQLLSDDLETAAALLKVLPEPDSVALPPLDEVAGVLEGLRERVSAWPLTGNRWTLVGKGLKGTYESGRRAARKARQNPDEEHLHEWRKRAKELRHQLETLAPIRSLPLGRRVGQLKQLCDLLGEEHDLSLLREALTVVQPRPVMERIDQRRRALRKEAERLRRDLYGENPGRFAGRVRGWWRRFA